MTSPTVSCTPVYISEDVEDLCAPTSDVARPLWRGPRSSPVISPSRGPFPGCSKREPNRVQKPSREYEIGQRNHRALVSDAGAVLIRRTLRKRSELTCAHRRVLRKTRGTPVGDDME